MIATVTLNPAIDYHVGFDKFLEGKSISSKTNSYFAGGKGINVSRVLKNLGCNTKALAFIGGFTGDFILSKSADIIVPIAIKDKNRINTKLKTSTSETEIHGLAPNITPDEFELLCKSVQDMKDLDTLVLSGSIPPSLKSDTYKVLASLCSLNTKIVIDTRGQALKECLSLDSIFLMKPNKDELGEFFGCDIDSKEEAILLAKEFKNKYRVENLILSLGGDGACLLIDNKVYFAQALSGEVVSSVGAGDSMVAGFVVNYSKTSAPIEAFKYSVACGAATAFSCGLCTFEKVKELQGKVSIVEI